MEISMLRFVFLIEKQEEESEENRLCLDRLAIFQE